MAIAVSNTLRTIMARLFGPFVPNEETIAAMNAARRGELIAVDSTADLLKSLNQP
jgi:DNA-damage-inducible protein J